MKAATLLAIALAGGVLWWWGEYAQGPAPSGSNGGGTKPVPAVAPARGGLPPAPPQTLGHSGGMDGGVPGRPNALLEDYPLGDAEELEDPPDGDDLEDPLDAEDLEDPLDEEDADDGVFEEDEAEPLDLEEPLDADEGLTPRSPGGGYFPGKRLGE